MITPKLLQVNMHLVYGGERIYGMESLSVATLDRIFSDWNFDMDGFQSGFGGTSPGNHAWHCR